MAISTIENKNLLRGRSISRVNTIDWSSLKIGRSERVSPREVMFFMSQLSLMLETGTPLNKSIEAISLQINNTKFRNIIEDIKKNIEGGHSLSETIAKHPHTFSTIYASMIRAGESGGFLKEMLDRIVVMEERHQEFVTTIRTALFYPVFLSLFSLSVIIFIVVYVFPKFGEMFEEVHDSLPITTRILMAMSHFLISYWYLIILFVGVVGFTAYKLINMERGRIYIDLLKLKIPVLKDLFTRIYISRFLRTLGSLINGNVALLESLRICSGVIGNKVFERLIDKMHDSVECGRRLSQPILESSYLPETVKQMINTGEDTGTLDKVIPRLADYYEEEIKRDVKKVTTIMEPLLLVFAGGIIGIIVISLILPIFRLSRSIH